MLSALDFVFERNWAGLGWGAGLAGLGVGLEAELGWAGLGAETKVG